MEQGPLYNSINFSWSPEPYTEPTPQDQGYSSMGGFINSTAYNTKLALFLCPSDGEAGRVNINSYHGSIGTSTYNVPGGGNTSGLFAGQICYSIANVTDGTSNTVAYSEALVGDTANTTAPRRANGTGNVGTAAASNKIDISIPGLGINAVTTDLAACNNNFKTVFYANDRGYRWGAGIVGYALFNTVMTPNGGGQYKWNGCRADCCVQMQAAHYLPATSNHSGGVNAMMADGSVRFVKDTVSYQTWWALGTRANGETISSDSY